LGNAIVVQGGTFANDVVLRAFELYVGKEVTRAPYPGLMGAIGVALLAKDRMAEKVSASRPKSSFIGFDALDDFDYTQTTNLICNFCANHCNRTLITFANGSTWVTGGRCPKGDVVGDLHDADVREKVKAAGKRMEAKPNLFNERERMLFHAWPHKQVLPKKSTTIGMPRVLAIWDTAPFWRTFFEALGFRVLFSHPSTRKMYESGLSAVTSDTICFPAKLVHGHVRDLADRKVDRIFMPIITTVKPEATAPTAESMCAVVKGYPMVMRSSDNPHERYGIPFDTPLFHWYTDEDRNDQLAKYMEEAFSIAPKHTKLALAEADKNQLSFRRQLLERGASVIEQAEAANEFAVVLASRPYQNDALVNHDLPRIFAEQGVAVIPVDAVPGFTDVDLTKSLLSIGNNYHARMLSGAVLAAENPHLEYAQIVSFGCGHDAYLSDEIVRLMHDISKSTPLILKVDESSIEGPLRIRVRSFIETVATKRRLGQKAEPQALADPYPVKFEKTDAATRTVLIPNTSHAFSRMMAAVFSKQGINAEPLPIGREEA
ncbi:MAG: activase, partial [Eggerthellaceae bacterium]|nr:activase [Eggerthellaceae bacterium]